MYLLTVLHQNCNVQCSVDYELEIEMKMSLSECVWKFERVCAKKIHYTRGTLRSIRISWFKNTLSWLSEIFELKKGLIIWVIEGKGIWKIFIVVYKMPRYLLIHHAYLLFVESECCLVHNNIIGAPKIKYIFLT